ncbi:MAG: hypothetical protein Q9187_008145, partial [Circinaria calcarea]
IFNQPIMGHKRKALSQAEIWDDSALLQSWDDALGEYKLYHSIYARDERVEDVIREAEAEEEKGDGDADLQMNESAAPLDQGNKDEDLEDGEVEDHEQASIPPDSKPPQVALSSEPYSPRPQSETKTTNPPSGVPGLPQTVIDGSSQNEALKNLMMSWYWAGYYTGHYEGQMQAQQTSSGAVPNGQEMNG